jgi:hypothetical protein
MNECPSCNGVGTFPRKCGCGVFPKDNEPLEKCATCEQYWFSSCSLCEGEGEVNQRTWLNYMRLEKTPEELEAYSKKHNIPMSWLTGNDESSIYFIKR